MVLLVANWKMNLDLKSGSDLVCTVARFAKDNISSDDEIVICPSFHMLHKIARDLKGSNIKLGAQDCSIAEVGAYTGDVSASMIKNCGCNYVILGHSERRKYHAETSKIVYEKAKIAHSHNIKTIICIGESDDDQVSGKSLDVLEKQLKESIPNSDSCDDVIIAYEPVWAIGTGKNPSVDQIDKVSAFITNFVKKSFLFEKSPKILYGGSVKSDNSRDILQIENVDGLLIGGASLASDEFINIIINTSKVIGCKHY